MSFTVRGFVGSSGGDSVEGFEGGEMGMGEMPVEPNLDQQASITDAEFQKDTKKAEI